MKLKYLGQDPAKKSGMKLEYLGQNLAKKKYNNPRLYNLFHFILSYDEIYVGTKWNLQYETMMIPVGKW